MQVHIHSYTKVHHKYLTNIQVCCTAKHIVMQPFEGWNEANHKKKKKKKLCFIFSFIKAAEKRKKMQKKILQNEIR